MRGADVGLRLPCVPVGALAMIAFMRGLTIKKIYCLTGVLGLAAGCSTNFKPKPCAVDSDCGGTLVCELRDDDPVCIAAEDAPIIIGQSAPVSGINQALGTGMKDGIQLALDEQNAAGGIRGRQLQLVFRDDGDPIQAQANAMEPRRRCHDDGSAEVSQHGDCRVERCRAAGERRGVDDCDRSRPERRARRRR